MALVSGCAEMENAPTPQYLLKHPAGTDTIKLGMKKDQVKTIWGNPDQVNQVNNKEKWGGAREEWVYIGRYSVMPISAGYLSKTRKLYFDGESLTNIVEE